MRHKTRNSKKGENEIVFTLQPEAKVLIDKYMSRNGHLQFGKYSSYKQIYSLVFRHINKVTELSGSGQRAGRLTLHHHRCHPVRQSSVRGDAVPEEHVVIVEVG